MKKTVFLFLTLWIFKVEAQTPVIVTPFPFTGYSMSTNGFAHLANGTIFWTAINNSMWELWRSDGTQQGTIKLKDFPTPISLEDNNIDTRVVNNTLYFVANDNIHGNELWKSDSTIQGTTMVADINIGSGSSNIFGATNSNGTFYFIAYNGTTRNLYKISDSPRWHEVLKKTALVSLSKGSTYYSARLRRVRLVRDGAQSCKTIHKHQQKTVSKKPFKNIG